MTSSPAKRTHRLTREEITTAALAATARGDLESLTMRKLADELGVTAMALYTHVSDKDEILDEIIDSVLTDEEVPLPAHDYEWRAWTTESAERLLGVLKRYPTLLDRYGRRPVGVPAAVRRMEAALQVLHSAGFDDATCLATYATIHTYTLGFAALVIARGTPSDPSPLRRRDVVPETSPRYWPTFFAELPATEFPNLTRLRPDLALFSADDQFRRGLDSILEPLEARASRASTG